MAPSSEKPFAMVKDLIAAYLMEAHMKLEVDSPTVLSITCDYDECVFYFYGKRDSQRYELENLNQWTLEIDNDASGVLKELVIYEQSSGVYGCSSGSIQDVFLLIQYFSSKLYASVDCLTINAANFHHMKAIQSIEILKKSKNVVIQEGRVSHDELRQILEGFEPEELELSCTTEKDFSYDHIISIDDFSADPGGWFKGSMLLNLDSEKIFVESEDMTDEDMNTFLHEWMKGTGVCAKRSFMELCRVTSNWNIDTVTKGLLSVDEDWSPLSPDKNRFRCFRREMDEAKMNILLYVHESKFYLNFRSAKHAYISDYLLNLLLEKSS